MTFMRRVGNAAYWAVFGTTWDNAGKSSGRADPDCPTCHGAGHYGGLPGFPRDPGSGVAPIPCGCRRPEPASTEQAGHGLHEPVYPSLERRLFGDTDPDGSQQAAKERLREQQQQTGEATLCCKRLECNCGQNFRLINGRRTQLPGTILPGSEYEKFMQGIMQRTEGSKTYSLAERVQPQLEAGNANETTMPLPVIFGGDF